MALRRFRIAWLGLTLLAVATPAPARQVAPDLYGRPVTEVHLEVEGRPATLPAIASLIDVAPGKPLSADDIRSSIEHLATRYEEVAALGEMGPAGVVVTFRLVPRHPVTRLTVVGETGIAADALRDRIQQRYGGVLADLQPDEAASTALDVLREDGYLAATVVPTRELQHDPQSATLVLTVHAGPLARIARTDVKSSVMADTDVIRRTHTEPGEPYRERAIDTALTAIEDDLRARGYYEAQATRETSSADNDVTLAISIDAGPLVELRVVPAGSLPGSVDTLIPIKRLRSADTDLLEDARANIEAALKNDGYWKAHAAFTRDPQEGGQRLVITFTITPGPRYTVQAVDWPASLSLPPDVLRDQLQVDPGDVFSEARVTAGLVRVIAAYQRLGYYKVEAVPAYEEVAPGGTSAQRGVLLHPGITEGPRGEINGVTFRFEGAHTASEADLVRVMTSQKGQAYIAAAAEQDREAIRTFYLDGGFQSVAVGLTPEFSADGREVTLHVAINEGPRVVIDEITIVGNEHVPDRAILEALALHEGQPLGQAALVEARQRLYDLAAFRRASVTWESVGGRADRARVIVSVAEIKRTTISFGGGLEAGRRLRAIDTEGGLAERLEFSPRAAFDISRRNLGGRNRSLDFSSRVSLRPRNAPNDPANDGKGFGFAEYRAAVTYHEYRVFASDTDLLFTVSSEQGVRTSFNFARRDATIDVLHRVTPRVNVSGRYTLDFTRLFDERINPKLQSDIDRLFPQVRLSFVSAGISRDTRSDATGRPNPATPSQGALFTADLDTAARAIGSEVGYIRSFFQARSYQALDRRASTVLAVRAQVGLAHGFPRAGLIADDSGQLVPTTVHDLPISQRFFAGGGTTVRGFQQDQLGVPEIFKEGLSVGGNGVIILNAEIRRVVAMMFGRSLSAVGFLDGGNVFANASDIDIAAIRGAAGFGVRYDSALGTLRLDFGFKLTQSHVIPESRWEYHLSIGEAF